MVCSKTLTVQMYGFLKINLDYGGEGKLQNEVLFCSIQYLVLMQVKGHSVFSDGGF